jgi:hypothetical protein
MNSKCCRSDYSCSKELRENVNNSSFDFEFEFLRAFTASTESTEAQATQSEQEVPHPIKERVVPSFVLKKLSKVLRNPSALMCLVPRNVRSVSMVAVDLIEKFEQMFLDAGFKTDEQPLVESAWRCYYSSKFIPHSKALLGGFRPSSLSSSEHKHACRILRKIFKNSMIPYLRKMPPVGCYFEVNQAQGGLFARAKRQVIGLDPNISNIPYSTWQEYVPYVSANLLRNTAIFAAGTGAAFLAGGPLLSAMGLIVAGAAGAKILEAFPTDAGRWNIIKNDLTKRGVQGAARLAITGAIEMSKSALDQVKSACLKLWKDVKIAFKRQMLPINLASLLVCFVIVCLGYFYLPTNRPLAMALGWGFLALLVVVSTSDPVFEYAQSLAAPLIASNPAPEMSLANEIGQTFELKIVKPIRQFVDKRRRKRSSSDPASKLAQSVGVNLDELKEVDKEVKSKIAADKPSVIADMWNRMQKFLAVPSKAKPDGADSSGNEDSIEYSGDSDDDQPLEKTPKIWVPVQKKIVSGREIDFPKDVSEKKLESTSEKKVDPPIVVSSDVKPPEQNQAQAGGKALLGGLACFGYSLLTQKAPTSQKELRFSSELFRAGQNVSDFIGDLFNEFPKYVEHLVAWMRGTTTRQQEVFKYCEDIIARSEKYLSMNGSSFDSACHQPLFCEEFLVNYNRLATLRDSIVRDPAFNTSHKTLISTVFVRIQDYYKKVISSKARHRVRMQPISVWFEGKPGTGKSRMINLFLSALRHKLDSLGIEQGLFNDSMRFERKQESEFWDGYCGEWAVTFDDIFQSSQSQDRTRMSMEFIQAVNTCSFPLNMAHLDNKGVVMFDSKVVVSTTNNIGTRIESPGIHDPQAIYRRRDFVIRVDLKKNITVHESSPRCFENYILNVVRNDVQGKEFLTPISFRQLVDFSAALYVRNKNACAGFEDDFTYDWNQAQMQAANFIAEPLFRNVDEENEEVADEISKSLIKRRERDQIDVPPYPPLQDRPASDILEAAVFPTHVGFWQNISKPKNIDFVANYSQQYRTKDLFVFQCITAHSILRAWYAYVGDNNMCILDKKNFNSAIRECFDRTFDRVKTLGMEKDGVAFQQVCEYLTFVYDFFVKNFFNVTTPYCSRQTLHEIGRLIYYAMDSPTGPKWNFEFVLQSEFYLQETDHGVFSFPRLREAFRKAKEHIIDHPWITAIKILFTACVLAGLLALIKYFFYSICGLFGATPIDKNSAESNPGMRERLIRSQQAKKNNETTFTHWGKHLPAHPNVAQGGIAATKDLSKKLMNNNVQIGICYEGGSVCNTRLQMLRGHLGVAVAHPFRYPAKIIGICAFGKNPDEPGTVLIRPEKYRLKFVSGKDLVYIRFDKGYMAAFKDIVKKHLFQGDTLESAPYPARVMIDDDRIIVHSGTYIKRGREATNCMDFEGVTLSEPVNDYYYAINTPGAPGLCGFPFIIENDFVSKKFVGIHTGANGPNSCLSRIEFKDFQDLDDKNEAQAGVVAPSTQPDIFKLDAVSHPKMPGIHVLGHLKRGADYIPKHTNIRPTPLQQFIQPTKIPAMLCAKEINEELVDPMKIAMGKYALKKNTCQLNLPQPLYRDLWPESMRSRTFRMLTIEEAIFGAPELDVVPISRKPSPGYPWVWMGFTREKLIDFESKTIHPLLQEMVEKELKNLKAGLISLVYLDCLKDETRPIEKVQAGKTRLFARASLHQYIVARMLFAPLLAAVQSSNGLSPFSIGIDPCTSAWRNLCRSMCKYGGKKILNGDFSNYDVFHIFSFALQVFIAIAQFFPDTEHRIMVHRYLLSRAQSIHVNRSLVYVALGSSPSGDYLTIFYNTIVNFYLHRVVFKLLYPHRDPSDSISDSYEGDDSIVAVSDEVPAYNMVRVAGLFRDLWGFEYTPPDKTNHLDPYVTIDSATFCQRSFRNVGGSLVLAPLNPDSLHNTPLWTEDRVRHISIILSELVDVVMREWFLHGRIVFDERRNEYNRYLSELGFETYEKTYDMLQSNFIAHYEL